MPVVGPHEVSCALSGYGTAPLQDWTHIQISGFGSRERSGVAGNSIWEFSAGGVPSAIPPQFWEGTISGERCLVMCTPIMIILNSSPMR